jgi:hypothetical protein
MTPWYVRNIVSEGARVGEEGLGVGEDGVKDDDFSGARTDMASTSPCESRSCHHLGLDDSECTLHPKALREGFPPCCTRLPLSSWLPGWNRSARMETRRINADLNRDFDNLSSQFHRQVH